MAMVNLSGVRVPVELERRVVAAGEQAAAIHGGPVTLSATVRLLLVRGLDSLPKEEKK